MLASVNFQTANFNYETALPAQNVYRFKNNASQKAMEVEDAALVGGTKVQQFREYERNGLSDGKNQQWLLIPAGSRGNQKVFFIINFAFLKYLQAGRNVTVERGNDNPTQLWIIEPAGLQNTYYIKSFATNAYIEIPSGSTNDGAPFVTNNFSGQANQQFVFTKYVGVLGPDRFHGDVNICTAQNPEKSLNIADASVANGATIQLYPVQSGASNDRWTLTRTPDGYYRIHTALTGNKCVDVAGWDAVNNNSLVNWDCADVEKQKWLIVPVVREPGNYIFLNKVSGRCIDVAGGIADNHATIQTFLFMNQNNQKWKFLPAR
jgi:hypothetical protein